MEMWKMRDWEVQKSNVKHFSDTEYMRGRMHCDRVADGQRDLIRSSERVSEHDDREARFWTRRLYEFEAKDPDRWGHSGFKELYPEEFESDSEKKQVTKKISHHKMKKSKSDTEASLSKHPKKSSRKKKKKKKKKDEEVKQKKAKCSSSEDSSDDSSVDKDKQRRKRTKSRRNKKCSKTKVRDVNSTSGDSDDEERERRTHNHKKRKHDSHKDSDSGLNSKKEMKLESNR
ncbi:uncharacterized protein NKAPD1 isoform X2 [Echeneis naucrates]|nr:uncharacterized protein NKAPD1 isoform X2 [Echeneis naucrates]